MSCDYKGLLKWQKDLQAAAKKDIVMTIAKELTKVIIAQVKEDSPVVTGNLRRSWNYTITNNGGTVTVEIINDAKDPKSGEIYASHVEYGHRQEPGRYVPAIGKRLVAGYVRGQFMLTKAEARVPDLVKQITADTIRDMLT